MRRGLHEELCLAAGGWWGTQSCRTGSTSGSSSMAPRQRALTRQFTCGTGISSTGHPTEAQVHSLRCCAALVRASEALDWAASALMLLQALCPWAVYSAVRRPVHQKGLRRPCISAEVILCLGRAWDLPAITE